MENKAGKVDFKISCSILCKGVKLKHTTYITGCLKFKIPF